MLEDKLLIIRLRRGSGDALCRIYEKYRRYLLKLAAALLQDTTVAEDMVHDVFVKLAQSAESIKVNGSLKAYLRTCVLNRIRSRFRAEKVRAYTELSQTEPVASDCHGAEQWVILTEESLRIHNALAQIPYEQREIVVLHLHGNMTFREIADFQTISLRTVQSRYRYGLDKLRSLLDGEVEQ